MKEGKEKGEEKRQDKKRKKKEHKIGEQRNRHVSKKRT